MKGYVGMLVRRIESGASCACYFDHGTLPSSSLNPPGSLTPYTAGTGIGPVTGSGESVNHSCYPISAYNDQARQAIYDTVGETFADYFEVDLHEETLQIPREAEVEYDQNENVPGQTPIEFDNHSDITMTGNTWTAYLLPKAVDIEKDTVLEFSFTLTQEPEAGFVAVCVDEDTEEYGDNGVCFVLKSTQGVSLHTVDRLRISSETASLNTRFCLPVAEGLRERAHPNVDRFDI